MASFYFDFCQGDTVTHDEEGADFADVEAAFLEAYEAAIEMWGDLLRRRQDPRNCSIHIRDQTLATVFVIPFDEMLDSCRDARKGAPFANTYQQTLEHYRRVKTLRDELSHELRRARSGLHEAAQLLSKSG